MRETDVVIGGSQADLAGKAQEPDDAKAINRLFGHDAACVRVHKGHPLGGSLNTSYSARYWAAMQDAQTPILAELDECPDEPILGVGWNFPFHP